MPNQRAEHVIVRRPLNTGISPKHSRRRGHITEGSVCRPETSVIFLINRYDTEDPQSASKRPHSAGKTVAAVKRRVITEVTNERAERERRSSRDHEENRSHRRGTEFLVLFFCFSD